MVELKATRDAKKKESDQLAVAGHRIMVMERVTGRQTTCRCDRSPALVASILCGAKNRELFGQDPEFWDVCM
jgi:hypothetical protein